MTPLIFPGKLVYNNKYRRNQFSLVLLLCTNCHIFGGLAGNGDAV